MKEATETRPKSKSTGYKGSKIGIVNDPGVVQSGFQHVAYKGIFFDCEAFNNLSFNVTLAFNIALSYVVGYV
jgi:hypothetical protein